jgi:hypothetical protein
MPNKQKLVNPAKAILARIKNDTQVFDVQTQSVHNADEIKALKQALQHYIDRNDQDWKVAIVGDEGNIEINEGDSPGDIQKGAARAMEAAKASGIVGSGILFRADNGNWYTVALECCIKPADPKMVKKLMDELKQVHTAAVGAIEGMDAPPGSQLEALEKLRAQAMPEFRAMFDEACARIRGR